MVDKGAGGCRNGGIKAHGSGITPVFCRASGLSGNSTRLRCQRKAISQPRAALNNVHSGLRKTCFQSLSTLCTNVFSTASTTCSVAFKLDAQSYRCYSPAQKKQVLNLSCASRLLLYAIRLVAGPRYSARQGVVLARRVCPDYARGLTTRFCREVAWWRRWATA